MTRPTQERRDATPPGGKALALAKITAEHALWTRVRAQRLVEQHGPDRPRRKPEPVAATAVLQRRAEWEESLSTARALRLPVHPDHQKSGFNELVGNTLELPRTVRRDGVTFRYGDVTSTDFPDAHFDAVTCMSVLEHGVPIGEGSPHLEPPERPVYRKRLDLRYTSIRVTFVRGRETQQR